MRLLSSKSIFAACLALIGSSVAHAQDYDSNAYISDRISRLESAVSDMQGVIYSVEQSSTYLAPSNTYDSDRRDAVSFDGDISVRIGQLERELQNLTGRIEEIAYQSQQNAQRIDSLMAVMSSSSSQPSTNVTPYVDEPVYDAYDSSGGEVPISGPTPLTQDIPSETSPITQQSSCASPVPTEVNAAYDFAFDALLNGDYTLSECAFRTFLETYPDDPRAADAQFRLGEIYLATGANLKAAKAFLNHVQTWPSDPRASESYLKLGTAYGRLGKTAEACQIFSVTETKFPNLSPANRQRLAIERGAAGC